MKELNKICRACMDTSECFTYILHENVSSLMYSFCTTIEVPVNDNLPMSLCDVCFDLLQKFLEFKHTCIQSNERLKSMFKDSKDNTLQCKIETTSITESGQSDNDIDAPQSEHSLDIQSELDDDINTSDNEIESIKEGIARPTSEHIDRLFKDSKENTVQCKIETTSITESDNEIDVAQSEHSLDIQSELDNEIESFKKGIARPTSEHIDRLFKDSKENTVQSKIETTNLTESDNDIGAPQSEHSLDIQSELDDDINTSDNKIELQVGDENSSVRPVRQKRKILNVIRLSCDQCDKKFQNEDKFEAHKLWHQGKTARIECNICHRVYTSWQNLAFHKKSVHTVLNVGGLQCAECDKVFTSVETLRIHKRTHRATQTVCDETVCDVCGKQFKTIVNLKAHMSTHKEKRLRMQECDQCGRRFYSTAGLTDHRYRIHEGRVFICDYCDYRYKHKANLIRHIIIKHYQKKKPYKCFICSKSFASSGTLKVHTRYHSGERPYECEYCKKHFVTRRYLRDHYKIHTGEKPYKCTLCTQAFIQKGSLNRHMKVHDKPVQSKGKAS